MALGFVVARFGLFLTLISSPVAPSHSSYPTHWLSSAMGIALVLLGAVVILGAAYNHRLYVRQLPPEDVPSVALPWLTMLLAVVIALIGILLAAYLAIG